MKERIKKVEFVLLVLEKKSNMSKENKVIDGSIRRETIEVRKLIIWMSVDNMQEFLQFYEGEHG